MRGSRLGATLLFCASALALAACGRQADSTGRPTPPAAAAQPPSSPHTPPVSAAAGAPPLSSTAPNGPPASAAAGAPPQSSSPAAAGSARGPSRNTGGPEKAPRPGLVTYTNTRYGFSLRIPPHLSPKSFSGPWSVETYTGFGGRKGTPVVSIPVFAVDHGGVATGQPYPLFFYAEVHVGVSTNTADCYQALSGGPARLRVRDEAIGGVDFKAVPVEDAGMMKYLKAVSYRVIHDGRCFAVEQIARGSSYRDSSMKPGLSQAQLDAYYHEASVIAHTFRFLPSPAGR